MNTRPLLNMLLVLSLWSGAQTPADGMPENAGDVAQGAEFELKDPDNKIHTLSGYRGKVVLVNFWASWCISCIREFPSLERLSRAMEASRFVLLAVNVREGEGIVQRFRKLQQAGIEILMDRDGKVAESWGVKVFPSSFIVDANGMVRRNVVGEMDWDDEEMHAYIEALSSMGRAE